MGFVRGLRLAVEWRNKLATVGTLGLVFDVGGPWVFDLLILASGYVGRPLQRRRARRLARRGKIRSALFAPSNPHVLHTRVIDGAAEVWEGRIRVWGQDVWVLGVEPKVEHGPSKRRGDGDFIFGPSTLIYTLRTHNGTVKWAVLDWQAEQALGLLGFATRGPEIIRVT